MKILITEIPEKRPDLILMFERETGKNAMYKKSGKITKQFKYWLRQKIKYENLQCDICSRNDFKNKYSLARHLNWHNKEYRENHSGENHPHFGKRGKETQYCKGDNAGYHAIHNWVDKYMPKTGICEICGKPENYRDLGPLEKSNKTGKLIRDINNFQWAHRYCHNKYDKDNNIIHEGSPNLKKEINLISLSSAKIE